MQPTTINIVFFSDLKVLNSLLTPSECFAFLFDFLCNSFKIRQYASSHRITFPFHFFNCLCFTLKITYTFLSFLKEIVMLFKKGLVTLIILCKLQFHLFNNLVVFPKLFFIKQVVWSNLRILL